MLGSPSLSAVEIAPSVASLYTIEGDKVVLHPHPGQARVLRSKARFILMTSGTQSGKTSFGPWWLWTEIQRRGGGDYIAATSTFDLFKLKMLPEIRKIYEDVLGIGRYWPGLRVMELQDPATGKFKAVKQDDEMWGRIILRSAEAPAGLESATAKDAWLDEVGMDNWDVTAWEAIQRRLSISQGRALGTTTVYNLGWTKREWYDRAVAGDPDYEVVQFDSIENPVFPIAEYERARRTLPGWRFEMFYQGRYAKPQGLIYQDFNEATMLFDYEPGKFPTSFPHFVGIDFGGQNMATLYGVEDQRETPSVLYIYAEYLEGGMSTKEHAKKMHSRIGGRSDVEITGGAASEEQERRDWKEEGIDIYEPAFGDVEVGINNVIELIKTDRLRVARHLTGLISELNSYRRKLLPDGTISEDIENKSLFHRLDALRYLCLRVTKKGVTVAGAWGR